MEIRKVQMTGGSSYIITLPKTWIKSLKIKKNDTVGLLTQSDGTLLITPKINKEQTQRSKEFEVNFDTNQTNLLRRLIGAYIAGYSTIKIKSNKRLSPNIRLTVRKFTQTSIGQEVVEETETYIVIKDLLNPAEMPFERTIKRMHIIVKSMHEDVFTALKNRDKKLAEDILTRDNEVDRLHWLVARQYNIILRNINFAETMGTTIEKAATSFLISRIIERIGDHVNRIGNNVIDMIDDKIHDTFIKDLEPAGKLSLEIFNKSITSFFRRDIKSANQNIDTVKTLDKECEKIDTLALKLQGSSAVSLGYLIESIRRIGEYSEDISETAINFLVGEDN